MCVGVCVGQLVGGWHEHSGKHVCVHVIHCKCTIEFCFAQKVLALQGMLNIRLEMLYEALYRHCQHYAEKRKKDGKKLYP